ncbi:MAG: transcription termination factor Rho [Clostridiales bacterium]|nr:transcription termination factor Rho [Clostridiales bacterium]
MTLLQLRAYGKEVGVKSVTTFSKGTLIEKIKEALENTSSEGVFSEADSDMPKKKKPGRPKKIREAQDINEKQDSNETPEIQDEKILNETEEFNSSQNSNIREEAQPSQNSSIREEIPPLRETAETKTAPWAPETNETRDAQPIQIQNNFREAQPAYEIRRPEEPRAAYDLREGRTEDIYEPKQDYNSYRYRDYRENDFHEGYSVPGEEYKSQIRRDDEGYRETRYPYQRPKTTGSGVLEIMADGYGFLRKENYMQGNRDIYISAAQIKRFRLKTGDFVEGITRFQRDGDKLNAMIYLNSINGDSPSSIYHRPSFESLVPIYPNEKLKLETENSDISTRTIDLVSPIGKGQRGLIVAQPKAGKTVLIKKIANAIKENYPDVKIIVLLIGERPEEVTDMKESIYGENVEIIYSTFDEQPEHHEKVAEMTLERAKRLVEQKKDIVVLLDSITRLARAYNLTLPPSGRTLSGGLDAGALYMPKKFFGSARNIREGGSLTILATALVETGSKLDDMVYEEFKGTGNMEIVLDRKLSERRIFPAIDILKSGTRREEDLLTPEELDCIYSVRRSVSTANPLEITGTFNDIMTKTENNEEFIRTIKKLNL